MRADRKQVARHRIGRSGIQVAQNHMAAPLCTVAGQEKNMIHTRGGENERI
jgi:hypothetical protein